MTLLGNDEDFTINPNADLKAVVDHINSKTGRPRGFKIFVRHNGTERRGCGGGGKDERRSKAWCPTR